jgi:hypothetical protein
VAAALCLAGLFGLGILLQSGPGTVSRTASPAEDSNRRSGSIVFVPVLGNSCRQYVFDNDTWQMRDMGTVDCTAATSGGSGSGTRVDVIRDSFNKKK